MKDAPIFPIDDPNRPLYHGARPQRVYVPDPALRPDECLASTS